MARKKKFHAMSMKKHGIGGLTQYPLGKPRDKSKKQRAKPGEYYAVVFFPQYPGVEKTIGGAHIGFFETDNTLSQSPEAAKVKFMDRIAKGEKWATYEKAGHRIRKIKMIDMGPPDAQD